MQHQVFSQLVEFDWDDGNYHKSLHKHDVSAQEAEEIFLNTPLIVIADEKHSAAETRYGAYGITNEDRKLFAVFTMRKHKVRIISVRPMDRKERKRYDQEKT